LTINELEGAFGTLDFTDFVSRKTSWLIRNGDPSDDLDQQESERAGGRGRPQPGGDRTGWNRPRPLPRPRSPGPDRKRRRTCLMLGGEAGGRSRGVTAGSGRG